MKEKTLRKIFWTLTIINIIFIIANTILISIHITRVV